MNAITEDSGPDAVPMEFPTVKGVNGVQPTWFESVEANSVESGLLVELAVVCAVENRVSTASGAIDIVSVATEGAFELASCSDIQRQGAF